MSKIIVRRQEYANNGTHANEIEAVVKQNLIVNTLSSALDVAPSVGLLKSKTDDYDKIYPPTATLASSGDLNTYTTVGRYIVPNIAKLSHSPATLGSSGSLEVDVFGESNSTHYIKQTLNLNLGGAHRFSYDNGANWTDWTVSDKSRFINANGINSVQIRNLSSYCSLLLAIGCSGTGSGIYAIHLAGSTFATTTIAGREYTAVFTPTYDSNSGVLTITNKNTTNQQVHVSGIAAVV